MALKPIKTVLKNSKLTSKLYYALKNISDKRKRDNKFKYSGKFINRSKDRDALCIVLAGYKEYLYDDVFERIVRYKPADIDCCVITSGKYSQTIDKICEKHSWSYLSTKENNVSLVQNIAISFHPKAKYIYKLDEDIFITENYFEKMKRAMVEAKESEYNPGIIAPLIPINGFSHLIILKKLGLVEDYRKRFEAPMYMTGNERQIQSNPKAAMFFWGDEDIVPSIDEMNRRFAQEPNRLTPCPIRFSIGAVLFERQLWEDMGFFEVDKYGTSMGVDETQICSFCMRKSRPIIVSENIVVGHFSFGPQTQGMLEYYQHNPEKFKIQLKS